MIIKNMSGKECQVWDRIFSAWGQGHYFNYSNLGFENEKGRITHSFSRPTGHNMMTRFLFCAYIYEEAV